MSPLEHSAQSGILRVNVLLLAKTSASICAVGGVCVCVCRDGSDCNTLELPCPPGSDIDIAADGVVMTDDSASHNFSAGAP